MIIHITFPFSTTQILQKILTVQLTKCSFSHSSYPTPFPKSTTGQQLCSIFHDHALLAYLHHQQLKRGGQQHEVHKTTEIQCQGLF